MTTFGGIAVSAILVLSVMTGCKESSATVDPPKTTPDPILKSVKGCIAHNIASAVGLAVLSSGVNRLYNWRKNCEPQSARRLSKVQAVFGRSATKCGDVC
jgi:hypothetical protein